MNLRNVVGLAAIGGLLYAHKRRGGQFTLESFKQRGRELADEARRRTEKLTARAEGELEARRR